MWSDNRANPASFSRTDTMHDKNFEKSWDIGKMWCDWGDWVSLKLSSYLRVNNIIVLHLTFRINRLISNFMGNLWWIKMYIYLTPYSGTKPLFWVPWIQWSTSVSCDNIQTHREILEEPRLEDAGSRLGKNSAFVLHSTAIRAIGVVVIARVIRRLVTVVAWINKPLLPLTVFPPSHNSFLLV